MTVSVTWGTSYFSSSSIPLKVVKFRLEKQDKKRPLRTRKEKSASTQKVSRMPDIIYCNNRGCILSFASSLVCYIGPVRDTPCKLKDW